MSDYVVEGAIRLRRTRQDWRITAYKSVDGSYVNSLITDDSRYALNVLNPEPVTLVCQQRIDGVWLPESEVALGRVVVSGNTDKTPYLFKCTRAGTTADTEPLWRSYGVIVDGSVEWTVVDNVIDPVALGFKIPLLVVNVATNWDDEGSHWDTMNWS